MNKTPYTINVGSNDQELMVSAECEPETSLLCVTLNAYDPQSGSSSCVTITSCDLVIIKVLELNNIFVEIPYKSFKEGLKYGLFFGGRVNDVADENMVTSGNNSTIESLKNENLTWDDIVEGDNDSDIDDDIDSVKNESNASTNNKVTLYFKLISEKEENDCAQHTVEIAAKKL